jgi:hypothetical protein
MFLYIDLDDLSYTTTSSGITLSGTLEIPNIICDVCGGDSFDVLTVGQGSIYDGMSETNRKYDALMVCLNCGNEFWQRRSIAVL